MFSRGGRGYCVYTEHTPTFFTPELLWIEREKSHTYTHVRIANIIVHCNKTGNKSEISSLTMWFIIPLFNSPTLSYRNVIVYNNTISFSWHPSNKAISFSASMCVFVRQSYCRPVRVERVKYPPPEVSSYTESWTRCSLTPKSSSPSASLLIIDGLSVSDVWCYLSNNQMKPIIGDINVSNWLKEWTNPWVRWYRTTPKDWE